MNFWTVSDNLVSKDFKIEFQIFTFELFFRNTIEVLTLDWLTWSVLGIDKRELCPRNGNTNSSLLGNAGCFEGVFLSCSVPYLCPCPLVARVADCWMADWSEWYSLWKCRQKKSTSPIEDRIGSILFISEQSEPITDSATEMSV